MTLKENYVLTKMKANVNVLRDWVIVRSKRCRGERNIETEKEWKDTREIPRRGVSN